ncbi:hypothetical protein TrLO_g8173 [Triparma laevis f. longispina]|uniref:Methyltransferase n=1 Tax=Triparma laevis f. longispina TaxID=1714387 RepID=A0A9W6ZDW2_9STRA|nr:hypothetical protein TrLO_g8173 [Triparma laevis f. longispina]
MLGYGLLGDLLSYDFEFTEILVPPQVTFGGDEVKCRFFFEGSVLKEYYVVICIASSELAEPTFKESLPLIDSVELERSVIIKRLTFTDIESTYNKINDQSPPPSSLVLYDPTQKKIDTLKLETYSLSLTPDITLTLEQRYLPDKKGGTDLGFGASVYPCSVVLSLYIYDHIYQGSFLELGSGPGLISCVCKVKGFRGWCTDGDSGSCELSRINLNKLEEGEEVIVEKYLWGEEIDKYVEYVFMSDVVARPYVEDLPKLINTLKELFKINPELKVLFSYKNRGGGEETFWRMAGEWKVERVEEYWIRSEWRKEGIEVWRITTK